MLGEGKALGNLGIVYAHFGQYTRAIEYFELALAIHRKYGDMQGEATSLANLGNAYDELSQYAKAIEFLEQALAIHRKIGDVRSEGSNLGSLGSVYKNVGEYARAIARSGPGNLNTPLGGESATVDALTGRGKGADDGKKNETDAFSGVQS